jgi:hypothetical protein
MENLIIGRDRCHATTAMESKRERDFLSHGIICSTASAKTGQRFLIDHVDSNIEPVVNVIVNWRQASPGSR